MISKGKKDLDKEYEKKKAEYIVQKKIEKSASYNKAKIRKMIERNKLMESIKSEAAEKLTRIVTSDPTKYKALMKDLVLQVSQYVF